MKLPFGNWHPDAAIPGSPALTYVRNAIPEIGGWWSPTRELAPVIAAVIPSPIQGFQLATRTDGQLELFAAADGSLYRVPSRLGELEDRSGTAYSEAAEARWRFVQYGDLLVGTNYYDPIQAYDLGAGGDFADLSPDAPRARYIAVVRDQIVVGYTSDDLDVSNAYRVQWHGFANGVPDPTEWVPSVETQADFQQLADVGQVNGLTGGEFGTIVCDSGVVRMTYVGSPVVFQFDTVERRLGSRVPQSVIQYRQLTLFYSPSGWMAFDGSGVQPLGTGKIDQWFATDFDESQSHLMWAAVDLARQHVLWLYPSKGAPGRANRLLRYVVPLGEWTVSDVDAEAIGTGRTFALDLDDITAFPNLDEADVNLDDPTLWTSYPATLAVLDGRVSSFGGPIVPATFEFAEMEQPDAMRAVLKRALLEREGGAGTITIGSRERWTGDVAWSRAHPEQPDGWCRFREPGRTHRIRVSLADDWRRARGVQVFGEGLGER